MNAPPIRLILGYLLLNLSLLNAPRILDCYFEVNEFKFEFDDYIL